MSLKIGKAVSIPSVPICPAHHRPLVQFCPACRGAKGGETVTPAKLAHLVRARLAKQKRQKKGA
jgi:hypothetical protein